ncbi:hypothetical protein SCHPADRAFT_288338 [Schizopora paradoxa]|uniref:Uncharacterized protein n=1 Tax=Schizopora paradoxa TaxID=27342 RepID=A0A0H2RTT5_9AGAM|nr:hypothetical protein SCHPADRAFT_288338 [Schizopora paradoxa]
MAASSDRGEPTEHQEVRHEKPVVNTARVKTDLKPRDVAQTILIEAQVPSVRSSRRRSSSRTAVARSRSIRAAERPREPAGPELSQAQPARETAPDRRASHDPKATEPRERRRSSDIVNSEGDREAEPSGHSRRFAAPVHNDRTAMPLRDALSEKLKAACNHDVKIRSPKPAVAAVAGPINEDSVLKPSSPGSPAALSLSLPLLNGLSNISQLKDTSAPKGAEDSTVDYSAFSEIPLPSEPNLPTMVACDCPACYPLDSESTTGWSTERVSGHSFRTSECQASTPKVPPVPFKYVESVKNSRTEQTSPSQQSSQPIHLHGGLSISTHRTAESSIKLVISEDMPMLKDEDLIKERSAAQSSCSSHGVFSASKDSLGLFQDNSKVDVTLLKDIELNKELGVQRTSCSWEPSEMSTTHSASLSAHLLGVTVNSGYDSSSLTDMALTLEGNMGTIVQSASLEGFSKTMELTKECNAEILPLRVKKKSRQTLSRSASSVHAEDASKESLAVSLLVNERVSLLKDTVLPSGLLSKSGSSLCSPPKTAEVDSVEFFRNPSRYKDMSLLTGTSMPCGHENPMDVSSSSAHIRTAQLTDGSQFSSKLHRISAKRNLTTLSTAAAAGPSSFQSLVREMDDFTPIPEPSTPKRRSSLEVHSVRKTDRALGGSSSKSLQVEDSSGISFSQQPTSTPREARRDRKGKRREFVYSS